MLICLLSRGEEHAEGKSQPDVHCVALMLMHKTESCDAAHAAYEGGLHALYAHQVVYRRTS